MAISTRRFRVVSVVALVRARFRVQRASRSFWASLLGWSCQPLGLVLPASWAGPASLLGWSCQPLGLVLPASWAGPASLLGWSGQPLGLVRPAFWDVARFDRLLLRIRVALLGADHNGGVHNLARHGQVPFCLQGRIEGGEQALDRARPRQLLAEEPDGLGIWNRMLQPEPKKAHEREAVADLTRRAAKQNSVASSERVYRVWSTTTLNISTGSYGGRPPRVPSERFRAETSGARNTSKSIRVASRISGSPLSDRAR